MTETKQDIGTFLRECRESLGIEAAEVSKQLRIRRIYIEAMDKGDFHELPGSIYIEGYVKEYAKFLKLNPQEVVDRLNAVGKDEEVPEEEDTFIPHSVKNEMRPAKWILSACLVLLGIAYLGWYIVNKAPEQKVKKAVELPQEEEVLQPHDSNIVLLATDTVQVTVMTHKNEPIMAFTMYVGDTHFLPDRDDMALNISDEEAVDVFIAGKQIESFDPLRRTDGSISLSPEILAQELAPKDNDETYFPKFFWYP